MVKEVMAVPYLEGRWTLPGGGGLELAPAGLWIPEIDREAWITRGEGLTGRMYWERAQPVSHAELSNFTISSGDQQRYAEVLGRDAASIQRDGFYSNFLEQLKHAMDDPTADLVVTRMQDLGFESPQWPQSIGGPPPHESPRPWKPTLNWLRKLIAHVARALLKIADFLTGTVATELGVVTVGLGLLPSPQLAVDLSPDLFRNAPAWRAVHAFLENMLDGGGDPLPT